MIDVLILAQEDAGGGGAAGIGNLLFLGAMVAVFWFLFIRPQRKRMKEQQDLQSAIDVGDLVHTVGGIHGRVVAIDGDDVVIQVEEGRLRLSRRGIASRTSPDA